jgi:hypothetical protein
MFKAWIQSFAIVVAFLPAAIAVLYALIQAVNYMHLDAALTKMQGWNGLLFEILRDHWLAYIFLAAIIAFIWVCIVEKPRVTSKDNFERKLRNMSRGGDREGNLLSGERNLSITNDKNSV